MKTKHPTRQTFEKLLYALFNVGGNAEPPEKPAPLQFVTGVQSMTNEVYNYLEKATLEERKGALCALRLLVETTCAIDPEEYALREIDAGFEGRRHENLGATIKLPGSEW